MNRQNVATAYPDTSFEPLEVQRAREMLRDREAENQQLAQSISEQRRKFIQNRKIQTALKRRHPELR